MKNLFRNCSHLKIIIKKTNNWKTCNMKLELVSWKAFYVNFENVLCLGNGINNPLPHIYYSLQQDVRVYFIVNFWYILWKLMSGCINGLPCHFHSIYRKWRSFCFSIQNYNEEILCAWIYKCNSNIVHISSEPVPRLHWISRNRTLYVQHINYRKWVGFPFSNMELLNTLLYLEHKKQNIVIQIHSHFLMMANENITRNHFRTFFNDEIIVIIQREHNCYENKVSLKLMILWICHHNKCTLLSSQPVDNIQ